MLEIAPELAIPESELEFRATRSGGPGGQHVNTSSTRIELTWNVLLSPSLSETQRQRILDKLANRIDAAGVLRLTASASRSQLQNREEAVARFVKLVAGALQVPKPRRKTKPPKSANEERLREKKKRSEIRKLRGRVDE